MRNTGYRAQSSIVVAASNAVETTVSEEVDRLVLASRSATTLRAYGSDWRQFTQWCDEQGRSSLPASAASVAMFVASLCQTHRPASIGRKLASISVAHKSAGLESPTSNALVAAAMRGAKRILGTKQHRKTAIRVKHLRELASAQGNRTIDLRDLTLLITCYAAALRRSEAVMLDLADLKFVDEGVLIHLRRSKGDQEGAGVTIAVQYGGCVATCPVRLLKAWLALLPQDDGPVFRPVDKGGTIRAVRLSPQAVGRVVQRLAPKMGLNPSDVGGHSMRAGIVTDAFSVGISQVVVARHSRHKSNVITSYLREADQFKQNPTGLVGL